MNPVLELAFNLSVNALPNLIFEALYLLIAPLVTLISSLLPSSYSIVLISRKISYKPLPGLVETTVGSNLLSPGAGVAAVSAFGVTALPTEVLAGTIVSEVAPTLGVATGLSFTTGSTFAGTTVAASLSSIF